MRTSAKVTIFGAILFVSSLLFAIGGTILGMIRAFSSASESGTASPEDLAEYIRNALTSTAIGIPIGIIGLFVFIIGLIVFFATKPQTDITKQKV